MTKIILYSLIVLILVGAQQSSDQVPKQEENQEIPTLVQNEQKLKTTEQDSNQEIIVQSTEDKQENEQESNVEHQNIKQEEIHQSAEINESSPNQANEDREGGLNNKEEVQQEKGEQQQEQQNSANSTNSNQKQQQSEQTDQQESNTQKAQPTEEVKQQIKTKETIIENQNEQQKEQEKVEIQKEQQQQSVEQKVSQTTEQQEQQEQINTQETVEKSQETQQQSVNESEQDTQIQEESPSEEIPEDLSKCEKHEEGCNSEEKIEEEEQNINQDDVVEKVGIDFQSNSEDIQEDQVEQVSQEVNYIEESNPLGEEDIVRQPDIVENIEPTTYHQEKHNQDVIVVDIQQGPTLSLMPNCEQLKETFKNWEKMAQKCMQESFPKDINKQVLWSVVLVSIPSVPVFVILWLIGARNTHSSLMNNMISFSFGTMLGDVFYHMLPQIFELIHHHDSEHSHEHSHDHEHSHQHSILDWVMYGILALFLIDLLATRKSKKHAPEHEHTHQSVFVFLMSDFLHNFTDGIAIGASYSINIVTGVSTTIAIVLHEIPHEIGDFAYLLKRGKGIFTVLITQIATALGCYAGAVIGVEYAKGYQFELFCFTCGSFLYVALANIMQEVKISFARKPRLIQTGLSVVCGLWIMGKLE